MPTACALASDCLLRILAQSAALAATFRQADEAEEAPAHCCARREALGRRDHIALIRTVAILPRAGLCSLW